MARHAQHAGLCTLWRWRSWFRSTAYAQSVITGTVRDASGAAMPGVTVEAASPVLIEKVKSVVSDGNGSYRIT